MWWDTHARGPFARQNVFLSSAPQARIGCSALSGSGRPAGTYPRERLSSQPARAAGSIHHAHDRVVGARLDRAVVDEQQVRDVAAGVPARPRRGRRSAPRRCCRSSSRASRLAACGSRCHTGPCPVADISRPRLRALAEVGEQQVVQRGVGQHHAELLHTRRNRRRHRCCGRVAGRARSGARDRTAAPARPRRDARARRPPAPWRPSTQRACPRGACARAARRPPPRHRRGRRGGIPRSP